MNTEQVIEAIKTPVQFNENDGGFGIIEDANGKTVCETHQCVAEQIVDALNNRAALVSELTAVKAENEKYRDALEKSGTECQFKDISTCIAEFDGGRLTKNKYCGGCMRREALAGQEKGDEIGKGKEFDGTGE